MSNPGEFQRAPSAKSAGAGLRTVAAGNGRPAGTVRGWLRRFGRRAAQLLSLDENSREAAVAWNDLADLHAQSRQPDEALRVYRQAVARDRPDQAA